MAYDARAFEARRRGLMDQYASTGAANTYGNFVSQQRGQRNLAEMNRGYEKAAPKVVSGYGRAGMLSPTVKSGAFAKAMREFAQERIRQTSQAQQDLSQEQNMFDLGQRQLQSDYNVGLQDLEAEKARQIEQDALDLMRMRSGF